MLALALALAGCAAEHASMQQPNPAPTSYRADIQAFLRTYLNDPTNVHDAAVSQPIPQEVEGENRYIACLRFNAKNGSGKYAGVLNSAAIFQSGKLYRFVDLTPDENASDAALRVQLGAVCKAATYQPFPEIEHMTR